MATVAPQALQHIPDDITLPQFFLDPSYPTRPHRRQNEPWLKEDGSGRAVDGAQAIQRTADLANGLKVHWDVAEEDIVCLFSPNHMDYPISVWAAHRLGAVVTLTNPSFTHDELVYQLEETKAKYIIVYADFVSTAVSAAKVAGIPNDKIAVLPGPDTPPSGFKTIDDLVAIGSKNPGAFTERRLKRNEGRSKLAFLSFSSGTTGKPKAVAIPHYSIIANILQMADHWKVNDPLDPYKRFTPGDTVAGVLPFFHIYGLVVTLHFTMFAGCTVLVIPKFRPEHFVKSIVTHHVTHLFLVPPQVVLFCKHPVMKQYDLSQIKFCMCGAAPLSGELLLQLTKVLPNATILQGYGLTETCTTVSAGRPSQHIAKVGSSGVPMPGTSIRVVKLDGTLAEEGESGELVVKSPSNALCYLNNETATKSTFVDGWVHTGDEVIIKEGEIYIVDRLKEMIKVRGYQVAPAELEGHLLLHPAVADACVVSLEDEYSGELPFAYVVVSPSMKDRISEMREISKLKDEILKHVSDAKVQYKWLKGGIEFIDAIPKTPSGKILRRVLRDQARAGRGHRVANL